MLHDFSEYMNEHQSVARQVGIRVCHSRDMSREQLQLLARTCPKLTHVSLYVDEDMGDLLTPLTGLIFDSDSKRFTQVWSLTQIYSVRFFNEKY